MSGCVFEAELRRRCSRAVISSSFTSRLCVSGQTALRPVKLRCDGATPNAGGYRRANLFRSSRRAGRLTASAGSKCSWLPDVRLAEKRRLRLGRRLGTVHLLRKRSNQRVVAPAGANGHGSRAATSADWTDRPLHLGGPLEGHRQLHDRLAAGACQPVFARSAFRVVRMDEEAMITAAMSGVRTPVIARGRARTL